MFQILKFLTDIPRVLIAPYASMYRVVCIPSTFSLDLSLTDRHITYPEVPCCTENYVSSTFAVVLGQSLPEQYGQKESIVSRMVGAASINSQFCVVLNQKNKGKENLFVLAESDEKDEILFALDSILSTLKPFVRDGSVFFTKMLLDTLVLPEPCPPENLWMKLVEIMEQQPEAYTHWHNVVQSLLYSACAKDDRSDIDILLKKGGNLEEKDNLGETPLAIARRMSQGGTEWLNSLVSPEQSTTQPLNTEVSQDNKKFEFVSNIIKKGSLPGLAFGLPKPQHSNRSALHSAASQDECDSIQQIVDQRMLLRLPSISVIVSEEEEEDDEYLSFKTPLLSLTEFKFDTIDSVGETPLMVSVRKGYVKSSLFLLLGGADPNYVLPQSGNTTLHIAAERGDLLLIKLLISFEADPRKLNQRGETPVELALNAEAYECATLLKNVSKYLDISENLPRVSDKDHRTVPENSLFLLSLDGGGVRGIMQVQILLGIQKRMQAIRSDCPSVFQCFDYIAGTSGGSYVMFITIYGRASLETSRALVFSCMSKMTEINNLQERVTILEEFLKEKLGKDTVMSCVQSPRVIVTATLADRSPCKLHLMTNYGEARDGQVGPDERKLWEAARITASAPFYFTAFQGKYLDGGMMANNPTLDAMTEISNQSKREGTACKLGFVLSLGTGVTEAIPISNVDIHMPSFSLASLKNFPENLKGAKNLAKLLLLQATQTEGQEVERAEAWCDALGATYCRISPPVTESVDITETNVNKMITILFDSQMYVLREAEKINDIAHTLLSK